MRMGTSAVEGTYTAGASPQRLWSLWILPNLTMPTVISIVKHLLLLLLLLVVVALRSTRILLQTRRSCGLRRLLRTGMLALC